MENKGSVVNADSREFWKGVNEGKLKFQQCPACNAVQFPPRFHCASCWDAEPVWIESTGQGAIESMTIVHRAPVARFREEVPYAIASVRVDEGPRMITRILGEGALNAKIGDRVSVIFAEVEDGHALPHFTLTRD